MKRYKSADEFLAVNAEKMERIKSGNLHLKSITQMSGGLSGPIEEAQRLAYVYLDLMYVCTDLSYGLSASYLEAKSERNRSEAISFRSSDGRVKDKEMAASIDPDYLQYNKNYHDLQDIHEYLTQKHKDYEKGHFYYKHMTGRE